MFSLKNDFFQQLINAFSHTYEKRDGGKKNCHD